MRHARDASLSLRGKGARGQREAVRAASCYVRACLHVGSRGQTPGARRAPPARSAVCRPKRKREVGGTSKIFKGADERAREEVGVAKESTRRLPVRVDSASCSQSHASLMAGLLALSARTPSSLHLASAQAALVPRTALHCNLREIYPPLQAVDWKPAEG